MLCGSREISFADLTKAALLIEELKDHQVMSECVSKVNTAPVSELLASRTRTAQVRAEGEPAWEPVFGFDSLSKVLSRYRTRHSTDPRDKVYALLRISRDIREKGVACLAPEDTAEGDLLVGLLGARVPYVIRATGTERYVLIGEWWVYTAYFLFIMPLC